MKGGCRCGLAGPTKRALSVHPWSSKRAEPAYLGSSMKVGSRSDMGLSSMKTEIDMKESFKVGSDTVMERTISKSILAIS